MKNEPVKFRNIIFPIWMLALFPQTWVVVLPANLLIDALVVFCAMKVMKFENIRKKLFSVIMGVWVIGFLSDLIGTAAMFTMTFSIVPKSIQAGILNPFDNVLSFAWTTICVVLAAFFIYKLNSKYLQKLKLTDPQRKKLALSLAICTAPYLFYLPTSWFY